MANLESLSENLDQLFEILCGMFVLFMQAGFAFLEAGSVRSKNTTNIIMKNFLDVFIGALSYYAFGYAFAYGQPSNAFIGYNHFFATNVGRNLSEEYVLESSRFYAGWFYQFVFAATASTIVSGAMAERTEFTTYIVYCTLLTGFVYPVVSHWGWADTGWLKTGAGIENLTFIDFAGSGIVHILGGTAAFVGAIFLGPRIGRFNDDGSYNDIPGHSVTVASLGAFILYVGFLAFNGGSQLSITNSGDGVAVAVAIMNTILGGSSGAIVSMVAYKTTDAIRGQDHYWSLITTINGGLAGMVSVCAGCNDYNPWSAILIGSLAGLAFISLHYLMLKIKVDDPLDAVAVHFGGGLTGVLLAPIFVVNGIVVDGKPVGGIVYGGHPMAFKSFAWNLLGAAAITAWTGLFSVIMFGTMKKLKVLRVPAKVENVGLDTIKHGEPAYPLGGYCDNEQTHVLKNGFGYGLPCVGYNNPAVVLDSEAPQRNSSSDEVQNNATSPV